MIPRTRKEKLAGKRSSRRRTPILAWALTIALLLTGSAALTPSRPSSAEENAVTICHRTGSEYNPYVGITVDTSALPAHLDHGDLYPVPPEGCPTGATPTAIPTAAPTNTPEPTPTVPPDPGGDH